MRKIDVQEMVNLSKSYDGKQVQVVLSPMQSINTYQQFRCRLNGNNLEFCDTNINKLIMQELLIPKDNIEEILYFEGKNIYESVFSIISNNCQVDFCISEKPMVCKKCRKLLDDYYESSWQINQIGSYGSQWDNERVVVDLCEDCLMEFLGYKVGDTDEF